MSFEFELNMNTFFIRDLLVKALPIYDIVIKHTSEESSLQILIPNSSFNSSTIRSVRRWQCVVEIGSCSSCDVRYIKCSRYRVLRRTADCKRRIGTIIFLHAKSFSLGQRMFAGISQYP